MIGNEEVKIHASMDPKQPLIVALLVAVPLSFAPLLLGVGGQPYRGVQERSSALCGADMSWIAAGSFEAGASGEEVGLPDYQPDIVRDPRPPGEFSTGHYCIDRYEWPGRGRRPLADVSWVQARVSCEAVGKRLCSEDEWVKSCGGVLGWLRPYGDLHVVGLCHADVAEEGSYDRVLPAGSKESCISPYGAFDQEGNVSEWVENLRVEGSPDRWVLGGTMWPGVYGAGCQARHAHPEVAPVAGDDGFRCCTEVAR